VAEDHRPALGLKVSGLIRVAEAVAAADPDRAERLITDAERAAPSVTAYRAGRRALPGATGPVEHGARGVLSAAWNTAYARVTAPATSAASTVTVTLIRT